MCKMKRNKFCIPCKIEGKKVYADSIVDEMPMCDKHKKIYYTELNLDVNEDIED